jgi:hypothetical protein
MGWLGVRDDFRNWLIRAAVFKDFGCDHGLSSRCRSAFSSH